MNDDYVPMPGDVWYSGPGLHGDEIVVVIAHLFATFIDEAQVVVLFCDACDTFDVSVDFADTLCIKAAARDCACHRQLMVL